MAKEIGGPGAAQTAPDPAENLAGGFDVEKRTPVPGRLRFEVLRRDNYTCRYCGASAPDVPLTVDHVIPVALGGGDEPSNLVTACQDCNAGKSSTSPDEGTVADVAADALRWSRAMERASELRSMEVQAVDSVCDRFLAEWNGWTHETVLSRHPNGAPKETARVPFDLPGDWRTAIERLVSAGLSPDEFGRAVDTAMGARGVKTEFRYFYGIAQRIVAELQEQARRILENGEVQ